MDGNENDNENIDETFIYTWMDDDESDEENEFENTDDPMRIPPDVFDRIMATDIETIFAGRNYTRLMYTRQFAIENPTETSVVVDSPPINVFNNHSLQPVENGTGNGETLKPLEESTSAFECTRQDDETNLIENVFEPSSNNSFGNTNEFQFHHSKIYRCQRGHPSREDMHQSSSTRLPYQHSPVISTSQSQQLCKNLPQPQMPCSNQNNDWPCLNPPRLPYQPREQIQNNGRQFMQQRGKNRLANRGKSYFNSCRQGWQQQKKCLEEKESTELLSQSNNESKYQEQKQIVQESVPIPKPFLTQETTVAQNTVPTKETIPTLQPTTAQLTTPTQEIDEANKESYRREFKHYSSENRLNKNKFHREGKFQNRKEKTEQRQSQHAHSNYQAATMTNTQPMFNSFQHPGNVPQQYDAPNQSQFSFQEERPNTRYSEMNQGPYPMQLTKEQYQMQTQYQQVLHQQRQWFYQLQYQQQQQFLFLQKQQQQLFYNQQLTIWQQLMHAQQYTYNYQIFAPIYGPPLPPQQTSPFQLPPQQSSPFQLPPRQSSSNPSQTPYISPRNYLQHQPNYHHTHSSRYHQPQQEQQGERQYQHQLQHQYQPQQNHQQQEE